MRKNRVLSVEALDARRVMAGGIFAANVAATTKFDGVILQPIQDTELTAGFQATANGTQIKVDGSIYDDVVKVTEVNYTTGTVALQLDKYSGGAQLSSQTIRLHTSNLDPYTPVAVQMKQGNDQVWNYTTAGMQAELGQGNDYLAATAGKTTAQGGDGDDVLIGGVSQSDYLSGGLGNDKIYGYGGNDYLYGQDGNDLIYAGEGIDFVYGGNGEDTIYGDGGNDYLYGEGEHDVIYGGWGRDYLVGGEGDDWLYGDFGFTSTAGDADQIWGGNGNDVLVGDGGNDVLHGEAGIDYEWGQAGNDELNGNDGTDYLHGGDGNDSLYGEQGRDFLFGDAGNDRLDGGFDSGINVADDLYGGLGADTFVRYKSLFGFDDPDRFLDFKSSEGDSVDNDWNL